MLRQLLSAMAACALGAQAADQVFVEAESFAAPGGWVLDTQFIDAMGSPYLMAHGLGVVVKDATTTVKFPSAGKYRVWVRTFDWVARWKAPGAPGKFQVIVDGKPLAATFGTTGADWLWQDGGSVEIGKTEAALALRDLTGFNGRCDAIYFSKDDAAPPAEKEALAKWRMAALGLPEKPEEAGTFDLVVCGGGYGGMGAAIAGARMGLKVALIQNRGVLGGNGSSEVRVWAMGGIRRGLYPNIGEIVEEFQDTAKLSPGTYEEFGDAKKEALVRAEKNIALFLNHHVYAVEMAEAGKRIGAVIAYDTRTNHRRVFRGKFFVDSTGHASVAALAGAEHTIREKEHLGMSNMWRWANAETPQTFPETPWALPLGLEDFPYPQRFHAQWFWESGFDKHPILELESTRDWNLRASFGAFNAMKNGEGKADHPNAKLEWLAYVGGTRESRQVIGDVVLTREDIAGKRAFPDGTVPTTWDIDLHYPREQYAAKFPNDPFISKAVFDKAVDRQHGYPVPYRCFYSKNIENLFTAGRDVSVTHEALGTVRVMKTGGMIGEVVGKAASVAIKNQCLPREVYERYWPQLVELLQLRGAARRETLDGPFTLPAGYQPPAPSKDKHDSAPAGIAPASLGGIVVDDEQATLTGSWTKGAGLPDYVAKGYRYAGARAAATARYEFTIKDAGRYEVRVSSGSHENRASNAQVTIESADGAKTVTLNQRKPASLPNGLVSLGTFRFEPGKPAAVTFTTGGADGNVHIDAVQIFPQP
ncbi:MAG: FAD-dependent oxidoreductase [Chthoniobacteraceae bacterium]